MDLVEGQDGDVLNEEVSLDSSEEAEQAEEEGKIAKAFDGVVGSRYFFPYQRLNLDPLWRQWELPIVKRHTEGQ